MGPHPPHSKSYAYPTGTHSPRTPCYAQGGRLVMNSKILLLIGGLAAVSAYAVETRQERGKRVVDEALRALGGEAYLHMEDRIEMGRAYSFYREQLSGLSVA